MSKLNQEIASFIVPKLEVYLETQDSELGNKDNKFKRNSRKFLKAMKIASKKENLNINELKEVKDGLEVFPEIFLFLWS